MGLSLFIGACAHRRGLEDSDAAVIVDAGSGSGGATGNNDATVTGSGPAMLVLAPTGSHDFGNSEIGVATSPVEFTLTNTGAEPTGSLTLDNDNPKEVLTTGCTGVLNGGASCTLSVVFQPTADGARTGAPIISATPGGLARITLTATGMYRLTITTTGEGTVISQPVGLNCGTSCTRLFKPGNVALKASTTPDQRFAGWTGSSCPTDVNRTCTVALSASTTIAAAFVPLTTNLAFVSSELFLANLGSPAAYDDRCNFAATAAGINDSNGATFVALVSSATSLVSTRLGGARGWVRMDGKPFFDTLDAAFASGKVFNAIEFDETGALQGGHKLVQTGLQTDGSPATDRNCTGFTGVGTELASGYTDGGPVTWATSGAVPCAVDSTITRERIICLGKTRTAPVAPMATSGKRIWIAPGFVVGGGKTPDAVCQASRPSDVTTAVALIAASTRAASAVLSPTASYVRPDGTVVGTGAQIAMSKPQSGIWQYADGSYLRTVTTTWTGSTAPDVAGTTESTCDNWTNSATTVTGPRSGNPNEADFFWYLPGLSSPDCAATNRLLYCVQTVP